MISWRSADGAACLFCCLYSGPAPPQENMVPQCKTGRLQKPPADDAWQQLSHEGGCCQLTIGKRSVSRGCTMICTSGPRELPTSLLRSPSVPPFSLAPSLPSCLPTYVPTFLPGIFPSYLILPCSRRGRPLLHRSRGHLYIDPKHAFNGNWLAAQVRD